MKNHIKEDIQKPWKFSHGHSFSSEGCSLTYASWLSMHRRCSDKGNKNYGGRGIKVCERWFNFNSFLNDMGERKIGMTIDRINPNGNYEPSNCKWSNHKEQSRNRRGSLKVDINGELLNLIDISEKYKISQTTIYRRYKQGLRGQRLIEKNNRNSYVVGDMRPSKLTWGCVREIRGMLSGGVSQKTIAEKYKVSQSVVSEIKNNKTWKPEFDPATSIYNKAVKAGVYES